MQRVFATIGHEGDARTGAPGLGADTDAVLGDLGYSAKEQESLRKSGVVTS